MTDRDLGLSSILILDVSAKAASGGHVLGICVDITQEECGQREFYQGTIFSQVTLCER